MRTRIIAPGSASAEAVTKVVARSELVAYQHEMSDPKQVHRWYADGTPKPYNPSDSHVTQVRLAQASWSFDDGEV
jgi:hypothetical protein